MIASKVAIDTRPAEKLKAQLRPIFERSLRKASPGIKDTIRGRAPRRLGWLSRSIHVRIRTYPNDRAIAVIGVAAGIVARVGGRQIQPARYAFVVNRRRPFLQPATAAAVPHAVGKVLHDAGRDIERSLRR